MAVTTPHRKDGVQVRCLTKTKNMSKEKYVVYSWPHGDNAVKTICKQFDTPEEQAKYFSECINKSDRAWYSLNYGKCKLSEFKKTFN